MATDEYDQFGYNKHGWTADEVRSMRLIDPAVRDRVLDTLDALDIRDFEEWK